MTSNVDRPERPRRAWARPLLAALGWSLIFALAWRAVDHAALVEGLRRLRVGHLVVVLTLALLHIAGRAFRFHRLMLRTHPDASYGALDGFRIFLIGLSTSAVTPARAGDFIKAELVRRFGVPRSVGVGVVLVERILDLLVITTTILVAGACLPTRAMGGNGFRAAAAVLLVLLVLGVAAVTSHRARARLLGPVVALIANVLRRRSPEHAEKVESTIAGVFQIGDVLFRSPGTFAAYALASSAVWLVELVKLWVVLHYLGAEVEVAAVLFVYPVSIVAGILTLLPFSEGIVGVTGVALLGTIAGVDKASATLAIVVDRGASSLPPLILWGLFALAARLRVRPREAA